MPSLRRRAGWRAIGKFWGRRHQSSLIGPWQMGKEEPEKKKIGPALDCPMRHNQCLPHLLGLQLQLQLQLRRQVRLIRACACLL